MKTAPVSWFKTVRHLFHPGRSNNHRARILHFDWLISLGALAILFVLSLAWMGQTYQGVLGFASDIKVEQVVAETNQERAKIGLPPVVLNRTLSSAALSKAQDMFSSQYWAHTSPTGKQPWDFMTEAEYHFSVAGENLARDFDTTPAMMSAWMASPTHRANIINPRYQEIGVAVVNDTLQGVETTLVVQMFGSPRQGAADLGEPATQVTLEGTPSDPVPNITIPLPQPAVLASVSIPSSQFLPPLFSPLSVTKAFVLAIILVLVVTLTYDALVVGNRQTIRIVGHNLSHLVFLMAVAFIVIYFKGGLIQ